MRRSLLTLPIALVTCAIGIFLAYDPSYRHPLLQFADQFLQGVRMAERPRAMADMYGTWGGSGENVIELRFDHIADLEQGKTYRYNVVRQFNYPDGERAILVEVIGLERGSVLRKYVYLATSKYSQLNYFGYDSMSDYDLGRASASVTLYRTMFR